MTAWTTKAQLGKYAYDNLLDCFGVTLQRASVVGQIELRGLRQRQIARIPKAIAMLGNERVSNFTSPAKYAVASFGMSRSSVTRASLRSSWRISASLPCQHRQILPLPAAASTHTASASRH